MIRRILFSIHGMLGMLICLLLSMWFISGLVLVYHPFPNVTNEQRNSNMESIKTDTPLPSIENVLSKIDTSENVKKITLAQFNGQAFFHIETKQGEHHIAVDSLGKEFAVDLDAVTKIADRWSNGTIAKIDTLQERDIWIMYNRYMKELPIYKIHFDDDEKHQLYISSRSGEVQQYTTFSERAWAYVGAIPHKLYFPILRKHTGIWAETVTVLSILCLVAILTGVYLGVNVIIRSYKKSKKIESPYRKQSYRWHHILGLIFSLFLITWCISGALSIRKVPQWMAKTHNPIPMGIKGKSIGYNRYMSDYRDILDKYNDVKQIESSYFQGKPTYNTIIGNEQISFDASTPGIRELYLDDKDIERVVKYNHGDTNFKVELINDYEEYYLQWKRDLVLPVYKVSVSDVDNSIYYINPKNGEYKYVNDNRKVRKWLFNGFHYFHIKWLTDKPVLWTIVIWTLCLGCTIVSLTGVWLGGRYLKRKLIKIRRRMSSSPNKNKTCQKEK